MAGNGKEWKGKASKSTESFCSVGRLGLKGEFEAGQICHEGEFGAKLKNDLLADKVFGFEAGSKGGGVGA